MVFIMIVVSRDALLYFYEHYSLFVWIDLFGCTMFENSISIAVLLSYITLLNSLHKRYVVLNSLLRCLFSFSLSHQLNHLSIFSMFPVFTT